MRAQYGRASELPKCLSSFSSNHIFYLYLFRNIISLYHIFFFSSYLLSLSFETCLTFLSYLFFVSYLLSLSLETCLTFSSYLLQKNLSKDFICLLRNIFIFEKYLSLLKCPVFFQTVWDTKRHIFWEPCTKGKNYMTFVFWPR